MAQKTDAHHGKDHAPGGADPIPNWPTGGASNPQFDIKVVPDDETFTTGDGQFIFAIPTDVGGMNLTSAQAYVTTTSSSGLPTIQIRNITQAVDMLSTKITIKVGELDSYGPGSTATASVVDTGNDDVAIADQLAIDVDVTGVGAKGLGVILDFA